MDKTRNYLAVLAKVMREKTSKENVKDTSYNRLYEIINTELKNALQKSSFSNAPDIAYKFDELTESLESLYLCPEINGKACVLIANYGTNRIFEQLPMLFLNGQFIFGIYNIFSQIPLIISNSEQDSIEVINYANERISLTVAEYKLLVIESNKRKIALNKIVRFFVIKTLLRMPDYCIISDNNFMTAEKVFERAISYRVLYLNKQGIENVVGKRLYSYDAVSTDDNCLDIVRNDKRFSKITLIPKSELNQSILLNTNPLLYGYLEHYKSIEAEIMGYYTKQYEYTKETLREVLEDIVRLGNHYNDTLNSIRTYQENLKSRLEKEKKEIGDILSRLEKLMVVICHEVNDIYIGNKVITRKTYNSVFKTLFFNGSNETTAQYVLSKLVSFGYKDIALVQCYIKSFSGQGVMWTNFNVNWGEWAKAKMILQVSDLQKMPKVELENCVKVIGNRIDTGKEYYAKALVSSEEEQIPYLIESFDRGYEQAGYILLEYYKYGYGNINLMSLVNALVPEACMQLAEEKNMGRSSHSNYASLDDDCFVYYKLAATKQFAPAIGVIVDEIYTSRFSNAFQYKRDSKSDLENKEALENGYAICQLCRFLINKMYNVQHYSEVLGVVLFCLNINHSESMTLLSKTNSGLSFYCRGNMYEFGTGVSKDLDMALSLYEKAQNAGMHSEQLTKRRYSCKQKIKRKEARENSSNQYQSTQSYSSTYHTTDSYSYDDGCFVPGTKILMSDNTYKNVEDLSIGDVVCVYNHYDGLIDSAPIVANIHETDFEREWKLIKLFLENEKTIEIVNAHGLFDFTLNRYVMIDSNSVSDFVGHEFIIISDKSIARVKLLSFYVVAEKTKYYAPISKFHLNVIANDLLTMPPTLLAINLFPINNTLMYDLTIVNKLGETPYLELASFITPKEYEDLPCKFLNAVLAQNPELDIQDFVENLELYRI